MSFIIPFLGFLAGYFVVKHTGMKVPFGSANYLAVAVLATVDSLVGGWRAGIEHRFDKDIFLSGFFLNAIAAGLLAFFGDQIGVNLTLVGSIVFGMRIFTNLSLVRTHWISARRASRRMAATEQPIPVGSGLGGASHPS